MFPSTPFRVRNYVVEKEINRGGYGVVYLAHSLTYNIKFAIKMCPTEIYQPTKTTENLIRSIPVPSERKPNLIPLRSQASQSINSSSIPQFSQIKSISSSQHFTNLDSNSDSGHGNSNLTATSRLTLNLNFPRRKGRYRSSFSNENETPIPSFEEALQMNAQFHDPAGHLESKLSNSDSCNKVYKTFLKEVEILRVLSHPNIITMYDYFNEGGYFFIVLEYCSGKSLQDLIDSQPEILFDVKLDIIYDIASALRYCHLMKVAHRDIKLSNILFDRNGRVKIADFGISKILDPQAFNSSGAHIGSADSLPNIPTQKSCSLPRPNLLKLANLASSQTIENIPQSTLPDFHEEHKKFKDQIVPFEKIEGSVLYLSPEVCLKQDYSPYKADVWAFGVLVARLLSDVFPFTGISNSDIINKIKGGVFDYPFRCPLTPFVNNLLKFDPKERPTIFKICQALVKIMKQRNHVQKNVPAVNLEARLAYLPPNIQEMGSFSPCGDVFPDASPPSWKLAANSYANAFQKMKRLVKKRADSTFSTFDINNDLEPL